MYKKNGDFEFYDDYDIEFTGSTPYHATSSRFRRLRTALLALIMLLVLMGGSLYQAWNLVPWIFGYWNSSYRITLSEVYSGECSKRLQPARGVNTTLCVCGRPDSGNGTADFEIAVRNPDDETIARASLHNRHSGEFCKNMLLDQQLTTGTYIIGIKPRLARSEILRTKVDIFDNSPQVHEQSTGKS